MLNSLFFRLFLAFWFLSAGTLFLSGAYAAEAVEESFAAFVAAAEEEERETLMEEVAETIEVRPGGGISPAPLNQLARANGVRIILKDETGAVVHDTHQHHRRRALRQEADFPQQPLVESSYPLMVGGSPHGEVTIISQDRITESGFFTPLERAFQLEIRRSVLWGGLLSLLFSAVFSAAVSWSVSRPIYRLKQASEELQKGRYTQKVPCGGPLEIQELSRSFQAMAEHLERSSYLKKKLTQDISHELRNPISSIKGYLEAFQDGVLPPDKEQLGLTLRETNRLERLAEDIHQLALADSIGGTPRWETVDLSEMGNRAQVATKPLMEAHNLKFDCRLPGKPLRVSGDPDRVEAAVRNLLQNALQHTPAGGRVELAVEEKRLSGRKDSPQAVISVTDSGEGVPEEKLPYVFERFYRVDDSRAAKTGGSGLGLSLVREWTRGMGGEVEATLPEGGGSRFALLFPLVEGGELGGEDPPG